MDLTQRDEGQMLEPDFQDIAGWIERGRLALQRLNVLEAHECLIQALNLDPTLPEVWLQYGSVLEKLGCYGEAIAANSNAQKLYANPTLRLMPPALEPTPALKAAIAAKQGSADYWLQQGFALGDFQRFEDAILYFEKALALQPDHPEAWFGKSNALTAAGRLQDAIASFEKTTLLDPNNYQVWNNFGYVWHQLGSYERAIAAYEQAIACNPKCAPAYNNRGFALFHLGLYDTAIANYDQAIALNRDYAAAWHNRGNSLRALERYEEAIANFDRALQLKPDFEEAQANRTLTLTLMQNGNGSQPTPEPPATGITAPPSDLEADPQADPEVDPGIDPGVDPEAQVAISPESLPLSSATPGIARNDLPANDSSGFPSPPSPAIAEERPVDQNQQFLPKDWPALLQTLRNPELPTQQIAEAQQQLTEATQQHFDELVRQDPIQALELLEAEKAYALGPLLNRLELQASAPTYAQIQTLLSPKTAAVYWHLSEASLITFVLRPDQLPQPLQLAPADSNALALDSHQPTSLNQCQALEQWLTTWGESYLSYSCLDLFAAADAPWRTSMEEMLFSRLRSILAVEQLCREYLQDFDQLILIAPAVLLQIPLQAVFLEHVTTTLPSAQMGLLTPQLFSAPQRLLRVAGETEGRSESAASGATRLSSHEANSGSLFVQLESAFLTQRYGAVRTQSIPQALAASSRAIAAIKLMSGCLDFGGALTHAAADPTQMAIALGGQDQLLLKDVWDLDLQRYSLLCLSACEADCLIVMAEETLDLVCGFLAAGAAHVLQCLWPVKGISGVLLTLEFHRYLQSASPPQAPAQALAQAQRWLRTVTYGELSQWYQAHAVELGAQHPLAARLQDFAAMAQEKAVHSNLSCPYAHPFYWAGFTVIGRIPNQARPV